MTVNDPAKLVVLLALALIQYYHPCSSSAHEDRDDEGA